MITLTSAFLLFLLMESGCIFQELWSQYLIREKNHLKRRVTTNFGEINCYNLEHTEVWIDVNSCIPHIVLHETSFNLNQEPSKKFSIVHLWKNIENQSL